MRKECTALALAGVLLLAAVPCAWPVCAQEAAPGTAVDIVFTHDTHSHLNTFTTMVDGLETELGGFARMNTLIEAQRTQNPDTLVIDGGDFSMGTLIQTVADIKANEDVDMIVCVSHSGTWEDESKSEDELLAAAVLLIVLVVLLIRKLVKKARRRAA